MRVVLSHVYAASNSGDGLLARLSVELIEEALGLEPLLLTIDPAELAQQHETMTYGGQPRSVMGAARELASALHMTRSPRMTALTDADLVVAIGGGYLRGRALRETATTVMAHVPQLLAETSRRAGRSVFLPQSIGPLPVPLRNLVRSRLSRADHVFVRDDVSSRDLRLVNVTRMPDLAALSIASNRGDLFRSTGRDLCRPVTLLQVRDLALPGWGSTVSRFIERLGGELEVVVQSVGGATNDDRPFTERVTGWKTFRRLEDAVAVSHDFDVAVCGRLHGALACIAAGVPTIHIAYERKSFGVYDDLGLHDFLITPRALGDSDAIAKVQALRAHPETFWASLRAAMPGLRRARASLVEHLRDVASACQR